GDGPEKKNLKKKIEKYKLNNKVILTGFRKDVYNFYHDSNVFILPSKGEGIPGVLLESMLYGIPIIASNIYGIRDLIKNNFNGFLCENNNVNEFVDKIKILLENKDLVNIFKENSKERIVNEFLWAKIIKLYEKIYKN
ncbi:MAG: glycosyltransferase, partial [Candidatus Helarchaeota archaeon]